MGRLQTTGLSEAFRGEASDFTPLLAERLDQLGEAIGVPLEAIGQTEVSTTGRRRIDIVAEDSEGATFVIENQFGVGDHDHLTRGLAYAVAQRAQGLVVVAEKHRDEFRAVAQYLNDLADNDSERGIAVWLVEALAIRVDNSAWSPLFTTVLRPNTFISAIEQSKRNSAAQTITLEDIWSKYTDDNLLNAAHSVLDRWVSVPGRDRWIYQTSMALVARAPSRNGFRSVAVILPNGTVKIPFNAYDGVNSGVAIPALQTPAFRQHANTLFGFNGGEKIAKTAEGWLTPERVPAFLEFCTEVADAYYEALSASVIEDNEIPIESVEL